MGKTGQGRKRHTLLGIKTDGFISPSARHMVKRIIVLSTLHLNCMKESLHSMRVFLLPPLHELHCFWTLWSVDTVPLDPCPFSPATISFSLPISRHSCPSSGIFQSTFLQSPLSTQKLTTWKLFQVQWFGSSAEFENQGLVGSSNIEIFKIQGLPWWCSG